MKKYLIKRLWHGIITILFITTATFFAMHMVPGDPLSSEKAISEETRKALEKEYGIDKPVVVQYGIFLKKTFIDWKMWCGLMIMRGLNQRWCKIDFIQMQAMMWR